MKDKLITVNNKVKDDCENRRAELGCERSEWSIRLAASDLCANLHPLPSETWALLWDGRLGAGVLFLGFSSKSCFWISDSWEVDLNGPEVNTQSVLDKIRSGCNGVTIKKKKKKHFLQMQVKCICCLVTAQPRVPHKSCSLLSTSRLVANNQKHTANSKKCIHVEHKRRTLLMMTSHSTGDILSTAMFSFLSTCTEIWGETKFKARERNKRSWMKNDTKTSDHNSLVIKQSQAYNDWDSYYSAV